jgi:hypothetical protein
MKYKEFDKSYMPIIHIDKSLEKYKGKVIFKEKLEEANKTLKVAGLPKKKK